MRLSRVLAAMFVGAAVGPLYAQQSKPTFEVASIRRTADSTLPFADQKMQPGGRFVALHTSPLELIQFAYDVRRVQVTGGPKWLDEERFDITARADAAVPVAQIRAMLQSLLRDRFGLVLGREQREMPVYELLIDRDDKRLGPTLIQIADEKDCDAERARLLKQRRTVSGGMVLGECGSLDMLVRFALAYVKDGIVLDKTGLGGAWSFYTHFATPMAANASLPSFFTAIREQLGLRLERSRGPVDVLVIESVQQPTEN
jgi:uncharacterized protein (TIGR03435 family)